MPCWTITETRIDIDAAGMNRERLREAAREHDAWVETRDGRTQIVSEAGDLSAAVKRTYAELTVKVAVRKHGRRIKSRKDVRGRIKLTVGR